jgi:hypothetical protein
VPLRLLFSSQELLKAMMSSKNKTAAQNYALVFSMKWIILELALIESAWVAPATRVLDAGSGCAAFLFPAAIWWIMRVLRAHLFALPRPSNFRKCQAYVELPPRLSRR